MESSYPVYAPSQPPDNRRSSFAVAGSYAPSQTLPPLLSNNYIFPYQNECNSQAPLLNRNQASVSHTETYPAYSFTPHGLTQYNSSNSANVQPPCSYPSSQAPNAQLPVSTQAYQLFNPSVSSHSRLPDLRPMPVGGLNEQMSSSASLRLQAGQDLQPTHVVGSQGRRGILPSAVGRPAAVAAGNTNSQKAANVPAKDAEGKFPCEHCTKTYLHAKHLKRHLLRHTGVRPYACGLCRETFSRSDILKRHFQKCSVRRGNPTGENHLSHSRATKKSKLEAATEPSMGERTRGLCLDQSVGTTDFPPAGINASFDLSTLGLGSSGYPDENQSLSNRGSRSNSVKQPGSGGLMGSRGAYGGSSSSGYEPHSFSYSGGQITPDSITTSGAATPFQYSQETRAAHFTSDTPFSQSSRGPTLELNGGSRAPAGSSYTSGSLPQILESSNGRGNDIDWSSLLQPSTPDDYGNPQFHSSIDSAQHPIKSELDFSHMPFPLPQGYPAYLPAKV